MIKLSWSFLVALSIQKHMVSSLAFTHPLQIRSLQRIKYSRNQTDSDSCSSSSSTSLKSSNQVYDYAKWDNLEDYDYDDKKMKEEASEEVARGMFGTTIHLTTPPPSDMQYTPTNMKRSHDTYAEIQKIDSDHRNAISDIYLRDPSTNIFWFIGKTIRTRGTGVTVQDSVARQWNLLEEHGARLRPNELAKFLGKEELELWAAPGNSEIDVAYYRPEIMFTKIDRPTTDAYKELVKGVRTVEVGYEGEVYMEDEAGFRTTRDDEGRPDAPERESPPDPTSGGGKTMNMDGMAMNESIKNLDSMDTSESIKNLLEEYGTKYDPDEDDDEEDDDDGGVMDATVVDVKTK